MKHPLNDCSSRHMWRIRLRTLFLSCLCIPLLSGCWDAREVEHLFYAHALGVDYQDGKYCVYAQILNPFAIAKESSKSEEATGAWIGEGMGSSYEDAVHDLYATTQRNVYLGHLDTVILSERLLVHEGVAQPLDILTRFPETRYTTWIFCTHDAVDKLLLTKPILESSPVYSLLGDPMNVYRQSSFIQPMRLNKFLVWEHEPGRPGVLPELSVVEGHWFDTKESYDEPEISGYGLLRNGKLIGRLSKDEATGMRWFLRRLPRAVVTIEQNGNSVATVTLKSSGTRIQPVIVGGLLRFNVKVKVRGVVGQLAQPLSESQLKSMVASNIEQDIRKTFGNGLRLGVDIYGLGDSLYRRNPEAFHRFTNSEGSLRLTKASLEGIQVHVTLYDSGRTTEPSTRFTKSK